VIHVVGHTAVDHILRVPQFPPPHTSTFIRDHRILFGGGAANIAAGIARLSAPVTLVSAVGGDFAGGDYEQWLLSLGVQLDLVTDASTCTPTAYVFTNDTGEQITYFDWGASRTFTAREAPSLDFVHLATADPGFNVRVAEKGGFVTFDPGQDIFWYSREHMERILAKTRILFANRHEMEYLGNLLGIGREELIRRIEMVVVTMDTEGSVLYTGGREHRIPVVTVKAVDPTGAGDAYRAGFLAAYHKGHAALTACRVGAVTASFAVEMAGCQTNLPDWSRMVARYWTHFGDLPKPAGRQE
jgi:sugar/nucleoside kinase (ribokinase family)